MDFAFIGLIVLFGLLSFGFIALSDKLMENEE